MYITTSHKHLTQTINPHNKYKSSQRKPNDNVFLHTKKNIKKTLSFGFIGDDLYIYIYIHYHLVYWFELFIFSLYYNSILFVWQNDK